MTSSSRPETASCSEVAWVGSGASAAGSSADKTPFGKGRVAMLAARVRLAPLDTAAARRAARCRTHTTSPQLHVMSTTRAQRTRDPSNSAHQLLHWLLSAQPTQHRIPAHTAHAAHDWHQQGSRQGTTRRQTRAHRYGGPANARCSPHLTAHHLATSTIDDNEDTTMTAPAAHCARGPISMISLVSRSIVSRTATDSRGAAQLRPHDAAQWPAQPAQPPPGANGHQTAAEGPAQRDVARRDGRPAATRTHRILGFKIAT